MLSVTVKGIPQADTGLQKLSDSVDDLRPFWARLGRTLSDESQRLWPLHRRSGRLRESLRWTGSRLGRGGIFEASRDRLAFGSSVFYSRYHQFGAKHTPRRILININEAAHGELLASWMRERAKAAGLEVT